MRFLVAGALSLLLTSFAPTAGATTAGQLCPGDPNVHAICQINHTVTVTPGSILNFGQRSLHILANGKIRSPGSNLEIYAKHIIVYGEVSTSGGSAGDLFMHADGMITVPLGGKVLAESSANEAFGAWVSLHAGMTTVQGDVSVKSTGSDAEGGEISIHSGSGDAYWDDAPCILDRATLDASAPNGWPKASTSFGDVAVFMYCPAVYVHPGGKIKANGRYDGGHVVLQSLSSQIIMNGKIEAVASSGDADGGTVTIASATTLSMDSADDPTIDVGNGESGGDILLLSKGNTTISRGVVRGTYLMAEAGYAVHGVTGFGCTGEPCFQWFSPYLDYSCKRTTGHLSITGNAMLDAGDQNADGELEISSCNFTLGDGATLRGADISVTSRQSMDLRGKFRTNYFKADQESGASLTYRGSAPNTSQACFVKYGKTGCQSAAPPELYHDPGLKPCP